MSSASAYARLRSLGLPVVRTAEAAAVLGISAVTAAQVLRRLARAQLIRPLKHGSFWIAAEPTDPWIALEFLSAPYPAYASLYSALYLRGVLSQIPAVHYAVTLGRTKRIATSTGSFSLHQMAPELFGGFDLLPSGARLATVEKALFDLAYLAPARSRLFAKPPELELPRKLNRSELTRWVEAIGWPKRRAQTQTQLEVLLRR